MLNINDINEAQELDATEAAAVQGGMLPTYYSQMTSVTNVFSQNAVNLGISAGDTGIISLAGGISAMPVSAGSAMTFVYSPAVPQLAV